VPGGGGFLSGGTCSFEWFWGAWRLAVRVPRKAVWKWVVRSGTCPPLGDFATVSSGGWFCMRDLQDFWWCSKGGVAGVPWVMAQNVSIELWLGMGVNARGIPWVVARNSISWVGARDGGWTRGTLEFWLGLASDVGVSVLVVASTDGSR